MRMKKIIVIAVIIIALIAAISGYWILKTAKEVPKQELVIGISGRHVRLGPPPWGTGPWAGTPLIYESLFERTLDGEIKPLLATSWEISPDGKVYTFHLRRGVKFHDGTPFNASAVKFSFDYCMKREPGVGGAKTIEVVDDYTVKIILSRPNPLFFSQLNFYILSPTSVDENGEVVNPIGTGPFMHKEYVKDEYYVLVRNPEYWQEEVKLQKVTFKVIPDAHTRTLALEAGEVDMIGVDAASHIPAEDIPTLKDNPDIVLSEKIGWRSNVIQFNTEKAPFNDLIVRRAVCHAINKKAINELLGERGSVTDGPLLNNTEWFNPKIVDYYPYDPERAKNMLASAGWVDSDGDGILDKNGKPFKVTFVTAPVAPEWLKIAEVIQSQLRNVGIDVEIQQLEPGAQFAAIRKGQFDIAVKVYGTVGFPPIDFSPYLSASPDPWPPGRIIKNSTLDELIYAYQTSTNKTEMVKICHEIQEVIIKNAPILFHYIDYRIIAMNSKVKNFEPGTDWSSLRPLWKAYIEE